MFGLLTAFTFAIVFGMLSAGGEASPNHPGKVSVRTNPRPNGIQEYYRTLNKYGISRKLPPAFHQAQKRGQSHKVRSIGRPQYSQANTQNPQDIPAIPDPGNAEYCSPITIGEGDNAKTFNIVFDTGSGDFWVYSDLLLQTEHFTNNISHSIYKPLRSNTSEPTGQVWGIQYGLGNATGLVFHDTVTVAGINLQKQPVEAAVITDFIMQPSQQFCDGIFGLYPLHPTTVKPGDNHMVLQDMFFGDGPDIPKQKVFTALLTRGVENPGFYTFGSIDQDAVGNQPINFVDVTTSREAPFWIVPSRQFFVDGKAIKNPDGQAIVDTGTTLLLVNDDILPHIYEPLGGFIDNNTQAWIFPNNVSDSWFPEIVVPAGNQNLTLLRDDLIFDTEFIPGFVIGGIQSNGGLGLTIYGDVWLRNAYAIFDLGTGNGKDLRFGFVPRQLGGVVGLASGSKSN